MNTFFQTICHDHILLTENLLKTLLLLSANTSMHNNGGGVKQDTRFIHIDVPCKQIKPDKRHR